MLIICFSELGDLPQPPLAHPVSTYAPNGEPDPEVTGGVLAFLLGTYAPGHYANSLLKHDKKGLVVAKSLRTLQQAAAYEHALAGEDGYDQLGKQVPLYGETFHETVDVYPVLAAVRASEEAPRFDTDKKCKEACESLTVKAVVSGFLAAVCEARTRRSTY